MGDTTGNDTASQNTELPETPQENGMETDQDLAEAKKNEGNAWYKKKEYHQAIKHYSEAIKIFPTCASYYTNRAAAYMMLDKYAEALHDAQHAISLDDQLVKGHLREAKCQLALGSVDAAIRALQRVTDLEPTNKQALSEMRAAKTVQSHDAAGFKAYVVAERKESEVTVGQGSYMSAAKLLMVKLESTAGWREGDTPPKVTIGLLSPEKAHLVMSSKPKRMAYST
eukprot:XP_784479.3 PREDICTED: dnaJ homolog subfamily C member 7 [Strongylocentrotus purpuratus]